MQVTFYGHSCFLVEVNGMSLLFDPFITGNALASAIDIASIKADYILVSHGHFDHVDDLEKIARQTNATVISNWEIASWIKKKGNKKHPPDEYRRTLDI